MTDDFVPPRRNPLNPKAVDALVLFFNEFGASTKEGAFTAAYLVGDIAALAAALDVDLGADRDTIEMAIRHSLAKED